MSTRGPSPHTRYFETLPNQILLRIGETRSVLSCPAMRMRRHSSVSVFSQAACLSGHTCAGAVRPVVSSLANVKHMSGIRDVPVAWPHAPCMKRATRILLSFTCLRCSRSVPVLRTHQTVSVRPVTHIPSGPPSGGVGGFESPVRVPRRPPCMRTASAAHVRRLFSRTRCMQRTRVTRDPVPKNESVAPNDDPCPPGSSGARRQCPHQAVVGDGGDGAAHGRGRMLPG